MRLADPRPAYCSSCFQSKGDTRFVDFEAAWDGPVVVGEDNLPHIAPGGVLSTNDDLFLCEACIREAAQLLETKPDLHARQLREIRRLENAVSHWRDYAKRAEETAHSKPDDPARRAGRPRKVAV